MTWAENAPSTLDNDVLRLRPVAPKVKRQPEAGPKVRAQV